ncbi:hypothetical protein HYC85_013239 [Camellia sinensis]|uniref:DNA mismatch repair proteins mutS family domain-containing protein n=1 Tax=Camellia sinensis TaxID=4442 RepID=A0A7J7H2T8_CAMSI|nr:hypothetical protein HYC85_013239 [Camellia sinensis]
MTIDTVIPNDTKIHDDALIVFLSHIGSFVPADAATVGLTDRIFCAIGSKFMNAEQSTFMIDLHQVGMMLRHATSRSLCLLDEFGKGTLTEDGTGLLGGTINHFITCYDPPKVLVCTHLTEMFNDSCIQESDNIKYYTMSVLQPDDGLHCALLAGVPEEVIKRAASLLNATGNNNHVNRLCNDKISAQDRQYKILNTNLIAGVPPGRSGLIYSAGVLQLSTKLAVWSENHPRNLAPSVGTKGE